MPAPTDAPTLRIGARVLVDDTCSITQIAAEMSRRFNLRPCVAWRHALGWPPTRRNSRATSRPAQVPRVACAASTQVTTDQDAVPARAQVPPRALVHHPQEPAYLCRRVGNARPGGRGRSAGPAEPRNLSWSPQPHSVPEQPRRALRSAVQYRWGRGAEDI